MATARSSCLAGGSIIFPLMWLRTQLNKAKQNKTPSHQSQSEAASLWRQPNSGAIHMTVGMTWSSLEHRGTFSKEASQILYVVMGFVGIASRAWKIYILVTDFPCDSNLLGQKPQNGANVLAPFYPLCFLSLLMDDELSWMVNLCCKI